MPRQTAPLCLLLATLALAPTAFAQERWYQVELLIFSHEGSTTGGDAEQWEPTPLLSYPGAARFLVHTDRVAENLAAHPGAESRLDEFGRQFITFPEEAGEDATTGDATLPEEPLPAADVEERFTPTPFVALAASEREFRGKAAYMQRTGSYRTLFHEAWRQPVAAEGQALPIIIDRSGDTGLWPRLQGSVTLHISRYLHIETNLWLNTSGEYLPGEWRMPAPPLGPVSVIVEEPPAEEPAEDPYYLSAPPPEETLPGETMDEEDTGPVYPFRHAILVQQKRRMRSLEVHYIDHPKLGVVIKFTPLDDVQLLALAREEFAQSQ